MHVERGTATITAGNDFVTITYSEAFASTPDLSVNPIDDLGGRNWWISDESATGFKINISSIDLEDHQFKYKAEGTAAITAGVTPDSVRNRLNLSSSDIDDAKVTEFIMDATAEIASETDRTIDYTDCTGAEAAAIKLLAGMYCICYVTGGSAMGLNISIGDLRGDVVANIPPLSAMQARLNRMIEKLRQPYLGRV